MIRWTHMDREYAARLREVRERLILMAGRVEEMIERSIRSLTTRDGKLAEETIEYDHKVNRDEIETDELCLQILARWQPMASDLRFVTLCLKMVTDLERVGDLAVNICERAIDLSREPPLKPYEDIPKMAELVQSMVHDAIDAFIQGNAVLARDVVERDDAIDALYDRVFEDVLNLMIDNPANIHRGIHIQSVAKWLERIGDHATNLAEEVVYLVKGKDIRHRGKLDGAD